MQSATNLQAKGRPADPPETRQRVRGSRVLEGRMAGGIDPPPSVMSKAAGLPAAGLPASPEASKSGAAALFPRTTISAASRRLCMTEGQAHRTLHCRVRPPASTQQQVPQFRCAEGPGNRQKQVPTIILYRGPLCES
jgi:hypothetical protein